VDLFARAGKFEISADAVVDFDVGSALYTSGTRLTQTDVNASFRVAKGTTLRAGTDYYENVDTAAVRDGLFLDDPLLFEGSGWRYNVGGTQALPLELTLDLDVNYIDAPDTGETVNWYVSLTRYGILESRVGSVSLAVYSIEGLDVDGIGARLSAYLPLRGNRVTVQGSLGFRAFEPEGVDSFDVTDVRVFASWLVSPRWTVNGGVSAAVGDSADNVAFDVGVQYRW
jgi:hypothetical protein